MGNKRIKWTYEMIQESASKYRSIKEWRTGDPKAYRAAGKRGITRDENITGHMEITLRSPIKDLTYEQIKESASQYEGRYAWQLGDNQSYNAAYRRGLLDDPCITGHMPCKPNLKWTIEAITESAKNYSTRYEWQRKDTKAYHAARRRHLLEDENVTGHMPKNTSRYKRCIYLFYGKDSKEGYIGLTYCLEQRISSHKESTRWEDLENKYGEVLYEQLTDFVDEGEASLLEKYYISKYKEDGWQLLNKVKGGALGGNSPKWSLQLCKEDALNYTTKRDWYKYSRAAEGAAQRYGWYDECTAHMVTRSKLKWDLNTCLEFIKENNVQSAGDFMRENRSAYSAAKRCGFLQNLFPDYICRAIPAKTRWSKETCEEISASYESLKDFREKANNAYQAAHRNGWLEDIKFKYFNKDSNIMSTCRCCQSFYSPVDYQTDEGYCPRCMQSATPYGYASKEYVGQDVTNSSSWINDSTNKQDTYHE